MIESEEEYDPAFDEYIVEEDFDREFEILFDCGYDSTTGICSKAGSEECEFECPYRDKFFQ